MESLIFFSGVQTFGNYGFVASHSSYDGTISYGNNYRKSWHLRVSQGYRVKITFLDFELESKNGKIGKERPSYSLALNLSKYCFEGQV